MKNIFVISLLSIFVIESLADNLCTFNDAKKIFQPCNEDNRRDSKIKS